MVWLWMAVAAAGYGDAVDGFPRPQERELQLWTNAVRVDPKAFSADYLAGGCRYEGFQPIEKTAKPPLAWNKGLNDAARFHSNDMDAHKRLTHDSSDGTPFNQRIIRYYDGYGYGENVAVGYGTPYVTVTQGWMCSSGHRSNIMLPDYTEFGGGIKGEYMTQDFGMSDIAMPILAMGIASPSEPTNGSATFYVDLAGVTPEAVYAVVDGDLTPLELRYGTESQGVYAGDATFAMGGCHMFWFEATHEGGIARFPETGAYGFGACAFDDEGARWLSAETLGASGGPLEGVVDGTLADGDVAIPGAAASGCDLSGRGGAGLGAWALALLWTRRGRRS